MENKTLYVGHSADGRKRVTATVKHDDHCNNGHNTFAITADVKDGVHHSSGCCHDDVVELVPELSPFIKWHLCSEDGPLHYIANTVYWVKEGNLDYARRTAIWPEATDEELTEPGLQERLEARLPALLVEFKAAVESLGLVYGTRITKEG